MPIIRESESLTMLDLSGALFPLPTPLTDDGRAVSEVRTARMMRALIERGLKSFLICGESGEFLSLACDERKKMLEWTMREAQNGISVVVNVSTLNTAEAVDLARDAGQEGAKAALMTAPYAGRCTAHEVAHHFKTVASFCPIPLLVIASRLAVQDHAFDSVWDIPNVHFVDGKQWESWTLGQFGCQTAASYSHLLGVDRVLVEKLIQNYGCAPAAKACLASLDIETGALRAPKAAIPTEAFRQIIASAA